MLKVCDSMNLNPDLFHSIWFNLASSIYNNVGENLAGWAAFNFTQFDNLLISHLSSFLYLKHILHTLLMSKVYCDSSHHARLCHISNVVKEGKLIWSHNLFEQVYRKSCSRNFPCTFSLLCYSVLKLQTMWIKLGKFRLLEKMAKARYSRGPGSRKSVSIIFSIHWRVDFGVPLVEEWESSERPLISGIVLDRGMLLPTGSLT